MRGVYFDAVLLGNVVVNEMATNESYRENFQFLFGLGVCGIFAALGVLIALACVRSDQIRRLERLEKLNGIEQPRESCGCRPLGDLATKGNR